MIKRALLAAVGAGLVLLANPGNAQDRGQEQGFYVKGDLGGNIAQDIDLKQFFGVDTTGAKVKLDPGFRGGIAGGYQLNLYAAVEAELGVIANEISSISGPYHVHDATFANVPLLANLKVQLPSRCPLTPYVGAGLGLSEAILDVDNITYFAPGGRTLSIHGSGADTVFAYQAFVGVRYALNPRMGLGVEYRFVGTDNPSWEADFHESGVSDRLKFGSSYTHNFSITFEYRF